MPSVIVKKSKINDKGVFAARDFKKGENVLKWKVEKILSKKEVDKLPATEKIYISSYTQGEYIHQQAPERYVNHSCNPNTEVVDSCDVALRDIRKGEEITSDYSVDNLLCHFQCHCGEKKCKKFI